MGAERGHPLGRRHDDLRLPPVEQRPGQPAAAGALDLQHHGARGVRRTAVRHGFRTETQGLGGRIHAHDRVEDLGAAGRSRGDRRHAGRRLRGGLPQTAPLRRRTGARLPVAGRPAGQLRRRAAGQGHRGRHPRREENLPDGHGHEPRGRSHARNTAHGLPRSEAQQRREDRRREGRLRPAGGAAAHGAADFAALRTGAVDPRHPLGGTRTDQAATTPRA